MNNIKLEAKNSNEDIILTYLKESASPMLAERINAGVKTLTQCWNYIMGEARKQAKKGCACIEDKVVFGWAIHFFEEDEIKGEEVYNHPVTTVVSANEKEAQKAKKEKKLKAPEFDGAEQIGFDFFGG